MHAVLDARGAHASGRRPRRVAGGLNHRRGALTGTLTLRRRRDGVLTRGVLRRARTSEGPPPPLPPPTRAPQPADQRGRAPVLFLGLSRPHNGMGDSSAARGTHCRPARIRAPDLNRRDALAAPATSPVLGLALAALRSRPTRPARRALLRAPGPTRDTDLDSTTVLDTAPRPAIAPTRLDPATRATTAPRAAIARQPPHRRARARPGPGRAGPDEI